jgi:hypothetical protein
MAKLERAGLLMQKLVQRDMSSLGLLDYVLMGLGSSLAAWSAGMAIGNQVLGLFSASLVVAGTILSYLIRYLAKGHNFLKVDGALYATAGLTSAIFARGLNQIMPSGGFPPELFAAGWLSWMLILGSCFGWRDATLLFQAVPSIAMFGLVGCYDTFREVIFPFYGFLVCLATFFARAHGRQMLEESVSSGFFSRHQAPGATPIRPETTPGLAAKLREGPWRWAAGPEWALASALVVVLISLLGAPVIQYSVKGVAGFIKVAVPQVSRPSTLPSLVSGAQTSDNVGIGRGAIKLTDTPVLDARMDKARYLRHATYDRYLGRSWSRRSEPVAGEVSIHSLTVDRIERPVEFEWSVRLQQPLKIIPAPGEIVFSSLPPTQSPRPDGTLEASNSLSRWTEVFGTSIEPQPGLELKDADRDLPLAAGEFVSLANVSERVINLARQIASSGGSDYEKAMRLKSEIESRVKYNVNVDPIPADQEPVSFTLFERKEGYCDVFASAMVQMARAAGIPARYATGFLPKTENQLADGTYLVLEKDAHAWAELFFKDAGWVIFDATEGAESVPGGELGASTDERPWYKRDWFVRILDGLVLLLIFSGMVLGYRAIKYRRTHVNLRSDLDKVFLTFTGAIYKLTGQRRGLGVTPDEYVMRVQPELGEAGDQARKISDRFVQTYFGPGPIDKDAVAHLAAEVAQFKQVLKRQRK